MNLKKPINYTLGFPLFLSIYKSKVLKCREDYDHMQSQIDQVESNEGNELSEMLMNPNFQENPEEYMEQSMFNSINPPQYAHLHSVLKNSLEHESWKGLKLGFSWHPVMNLNSELQITGDRPRGFLKNYSFSTTTIIPNETNPNKGTVFMARSDGGQKLMFQAHTDVTSKDKLILAAHYMSKDYKEGALEIEYNRKFERMIVDLKYSPMGISLSGVSALRKGTFLGFETIYNSKAPALMYNYGFKTSTPINKLHVAGTYISYMPLYMFDAMYKINKDMSLYFNYTKNDMQGVKDTKFTYKLKHKENDIMVGLDNFANIQTYGAYKLNKFVSVKVNLEISPSSVYNRNFRGLVNKFGIGLHFNSHSQEDLITNNSEDFSNFDYDNYLKN